MAIDPTKAEEALDFLLNVSELEEIYRAAKSAERMIQYEEALLVKGMDNQKLAANLKQAYARADDRWKRRADVEAEAYAKLKVTEAERDAKKLSIMVYMNQNKDRL